MALRHIALIKFYGFEVGLGAFMCGVVALDSASKLAMRESPDEASNHCDKVPKLSRKHIQEFIHRGIVVIDDVLDIAELNVARNEVNILVDEGIAFEMNGNNDSDVRTDHVMWISEVVSDRQSLTIGAGIRRALQCVRSIPNELVNTGCHESMLLGVPFENQLSCYDGAGSNYIAHRDSPIASTYHTLIGSYIHPGVEDRVVTIILYLNDAEWDLNYGGSIDNGALKCYLNADNINAGDQTGTSATEVLQIAPRGGRMVIFDSQRILHEVCPSSQRRIAITCWAGGRHSHFRFLRSFCIPWSELNWSFIRTEVVRKWKKCNGK